MATSTHKMIFSCLLFAITTCIYATTVIDKQEPIDMVPS